MEDSVPISTAMLIDDEKIDQMMYKRVINRTNMVENIISFTYAEEALEYLKGEGKDKVDVIFLDINMPRMNGFEFLDAAADEIGENFAKAVIIMLTTSLDLRDRERAARYDVVKDYINKPLEPDDLKRVAELLREKDAA